MNHSDLIALAVGLLPFLSAIAGALFQQLSASLPASARKRVDGAAWTAVEAVEQTMSALPGATNADKKAEAVRLVGLALGRLGVREVPADVVSAAVEAAVAALPSTHPAVPASPVPPPPPLTPGL